MNELFLHLSNLGDLFFHHTYLYYDEPLIFSCATQALQYFFVIAVPAAKQNADAWLIIPISTGRLAKAEKNIIEIRDLVLKPETIVWYVTCDNEGTDISVISPESLNEEMLPVKGEYLDYTASLELLPPKETPFDQASNEMRDIIEISLEKDDGHTQELPCMTIVDALDNVQQLVYALAYKDGGLRGAIPQRIKDECQLCVSGMFAASVGIRLKSNDLCDMYFETPLTETLNSFHRLFEVSSDKETLRDFLKTQNPRVAYRFRNLIVSLLHGNVGLNLNNASPNKSVYSNHFTTKELSRRLALIEAEVDEYVETQSFFGQLVGINVQRHTFEFITTGEEHIRGKISLEISEDVFSVPQMSEAVIEMRIGQDKMTRAEKILYTLVDVKPMVPT